MISLRVITHDDASSLKDTDYGRMTDKDTFGMINDSRNKSHNGRYFEFFVVEDNGSIVGFMSLYAHSKHIISCSPEIKPSFRKKGYAFEAETRILEFAKSNGYTVAVAGVREENIASRALHEKLGFELDRVYTNKNNAKICLYIRSL